MRLSNVIVVFSIALSIGLNPVAAGEKSDERTYTILAEIQPEDLSNVLELAEAEVRQGLHRQGAETQLNSVRMDVEQNQINIDLTKDYLPTGVDYVPGSLEEDLHAITVAVLGLIENTLGLQLYGVTYTFDGLPLSEYFPNDFPSKEQSQYKIESEAVASGGTNGVVLSAGHGYFRNFRTTPFQWTFQRDPYFSIQEDLITHELVNTLVGIFSERSIHSPVTVRSNSYKPHGPSGHPWYEMAARYYLEALLPSQKDIWNSLPNETISWRREMDEDIRARPKYANFIGAAGIVSIHTNGDPNPAPRGVRVYYETGRNADRELANHMLCYMKEIIQAQDDYEDFPVSSAAHSGMLGENRWAQGRRAVIVENGFHSNPLDAAALSDPIFREASMKGVEKGARLYEAGKPCRHFQLEELEDIDQPWGVTGILEIPFEGFPQFPVTVKVAQQNCGSVCGYHEVMVEEEVESPFIFPWYCDGAPPGHPPLPPIEFQVTAEDVDRVETDPKGFVFTCGV